MKIITIKEKLSSFFIVTLWQFFEIHFSAVHNSEGPKQLIELATKAALEVKLTIFKGILKPVSQNCMSDFRTYRLCISLKNTTNI